MTWENKADKTLFKPAEREDGLRGGQGFGIWERRRERREGPRTAEAWYCDVCTKYVQVFAVKGK